MWLLLKVLGPEVVPNHASRAQGEHAANMFLPIVSLSGCFLILNVFGPDHSLTGTGTFSPCFDLA